MPEYNALNEKLKKQYEEVLTHGLHRAKQTIDAVWKDINQFEKYTNLANFTSFNKEQAIGFKRWLESQKNTKGERLSVSTVRSTLANLRRFFEWLAIHPQCIRKINGQDAGYLHMSSNDERASRATRETAVPTFDDLKLVLENMPHDTDIQKRDRAIIAFTALTGIRDDALVTMKIKHIDMKKREIWQNPRQVRTKKRKNITTYFMPFDPLWEGIFTDWYEYITKILKFKPDDALFPKQLVKNNPEKMAFEVVGLSRDHWANAQPVRDIFKSAFTDVDLQYYTPHSLRHMLVHWMMDNGTQYQFKAVSQNIAHAQAMTTYNAYGNLNPQDQRKAISTIGHANTDLQSISNDALFAELSRRTQK